MYLNDRDLKILKWILEKQDRMVRTEFMELRVGTSGSEYNNNRYGSIKYL
jgi:hypothetical protein